MSLLWAEVIQVTIIAELDKVPLVESQSPLAAVAVVEQLQVLTLSNPRNIILLL